MHRRISGPHVCGDGLAIHPTNYSIATASWRLKETVQVSIYTGTRSVYHSPHQAYKGEGLSLHIEYRGRG